MNNGKAPGVTFGLIVGNRGFFPDHLAQSGRSEMIAVLEKAGYGVVVPGPRKPSTAPWKRAPRRALRRSV